MSSCTRAVAVAVSTGRHGALRERVDEIGDLQIARAKSCPHWEMQCASSTAMSGMEIVCASFPKPGAPSRSGAT